MKKVILLFVFLTLKIFASPLFENIKNPFIVSFGYNVGGKMELDSSNSIDTSNAPLIRVKYIMSQRNGLTVGPYIDYSHNSEWENSTVKSNMMTYGIFAKYKSRSNTYLVGSYGFNKVNIDDEELFNLFKSSLDSYDVDAPSSVKTGVTVMIGIGHEINSKFAIEALLQNSTYTYSQNITVSDNTSSTSLSGKMDVTYSTLSIGGVVNL